MNKIKAFFNNKIVQIVTWSILAISTLVLTIGGVFIGNTDKLPTFIVGIANAVALFIVFGKAFFGNKAFFNNKVVQTVAWILIAVSTLVLILGGVSAGGTAKVLTLIVGIVYVVALLIVFIKEMLQAKGTVKK